MSRMFTVASLAQEWECSDSLVRKLIANGQLGCVRLGTLIRIPADEVRRFESQNTACSDSAAGSQSSIETPEESATESSFVRRTALGLKRKQEGDGRQATVHHGPWAASS